MKSVSVVVLAYGGEPLLQDCVQAILDSRDVAVEVLLIDNGYHDSEVIDALELLPSVCVLRPGRNLGFAGGCNAGVSKATGDVIALVNGDALVEEGALATLAEAVSAPGVGIATASVRLAHEPEALNTAGNPVHFLGFSWSGHFGEDARNFPNCSEVASASGATMALRREVWDLLGGFEDKYFAYHEDTDLSLRCWQRGLRVIYVPGAVSLHRYDFSRHPAKYYLVERNRLLNLLTLFEVRTLMLILPPLIAVEVALLVVAVRQGWLRDKMRAYVWLWEHVDWVKRRRNAIQATRTVPDREMARLYTGNLNPTIMPLPRALRCLDTTMSHYWSVTKRLI